MNATLGTAILGQMRLGNTQNMYSQRMLNYYPEVIKAILEFKVIVDSEGLEFDVIQHKLEQIINNAYLSTMLEDRVVVWENLLGIKPLEDSTLDDRRDTVIARIRGQGKLNTKLINIIVKTFTGGTANSWVKDSVLYVEITPPPNNKSYRFENVEQELRKKVPVHIGLNVSRNYLTWGDVKKSYRTWQDVKDSFGTWNDVIIYSPFTEVN